MKQRIVGAVVLVSLAVIFIPMLLDSNRQYDRVIVKTNIPPKPKGFNSKIIPLELEKPAGVNTQASTKTLVPTTSPSIKPLSTATPTTEKKPPVVSAKPASKPVASKPVTQTLKKEAPKQPSKAVPKPAPKPATKDDGSAVAAIDKSTRLARVEPVVSGQPLAAASPTSAGAPVTDSSDKSARTGVAAWAVQVGSFGQEVNANTLRDKLRKQGYASFVERIYGKSAVSYRVRIGPELEKKRADALRDRLASREKLNGIVVRYP